MQHFLRAIRERTHSWKRKMTTYYCQRLNLRTKVRAATVFRVRLYVTRRRGVGTTGGGGGLVAEKNRNKNVQQHRDIVRVLLLCSRGERSRCTIADSALFEIVILLLPPQFRVVFAPCVRCHARNTRPLRCAHGSNWVSKNERQCERDTIWMHLRTFRISFSRQQSNACTL